MLYLHLYRVKTIQRFQKPKAYNSFNKWSTNQQGRRRLLFQKHCSRAMGELFVSDKLSHVCEFTKPICINEGLTLHKNKIGGYLTIKSGSVQEENDNGKPICSWKKSMFMMRMNNKLHRTSDWKTGFLKGSIKINCRNESWMDC